MPHRNSGTNRLQSDTVLFGGVLIAAVIALLASFVLSIEAITLAKNADAVLACSINAVFNCAAVALHPSSEVFGFPNSFVGMVTMPVVITIAVLKLARVQMPRWFMAGLQLGVTAGLLFAGWMLYMSFAVIQVFCPWCLTVDVAMLVMFFFVSRYSILNHVCRPPEKIRAGLEAYVKGSYDIMLLVGIIVAIAAIIIAKYGDGLF